MHRFFKHFPNALSGAGFYFCWMQKIITQCLFLLMACSSVTRVSAQAKYPQQYFRWPLSLAPEIVANMGELRPNHWHMGLDMRTAQKVNQPVYAAAEGYVAYAGIRAFSFGRFLVVRHPNGLSTLYAHLNDFSPAIEAYVTEQQYRQESWATELTLPAGRFPVKKGDLIAYSGTTGGSQGPHVHFEIMDTRSEKRLNPLLFGMPLADNVPPVISRLAMYDRGRSVYEQKPVLFAVRDTDSGYILPQAPVIRTGLRKTSFAIQAFDRISGSANQDGIYSATIFLDDAPLAGFVIDSIGYEDTRYMNAQIDHSYKYNGGAFLQHLSRLPGDKGGVYHPVRNDGVITLNDTVLHAVRIEVSDAYRNRVTLKFMLQYSDSLAALLPPAVPRGTGIWVPEQANILEKPDFEIYLPEACLYDTVPVRYYRTNSASANAVSALHQVQDGAIPVQEEFTVRIKPDRIIEDSWKDRIVIRRTDKSNSLVRAVWQGGWLMGKFRDFGSFQAFADLQPPVIGELGKGDTVNLSASSRISFTPSDNFGVRSFRAELNGKWLRFTNDKGRTWIYDFDERCPYGVHHLKVTVEDIAGNVATREWWFRRSPYTPPVKKAASRKQPAKKAGPAVQKKKK